MEEKLCAAAGDLSHLYMTIFLHSFATFMVIPAITDVTMSALCPATDHCSFAIYLSATQQASERGMERLSSLGHLFVVMFLHSFSTFMVIPAMADITISAICPPQYQCSLAIYLTAIHHVMIGLGSLVMMPLVGNLSDKYGRKALLTLPLALTVIPLAILAYSRTRNFFYAYFILKTLTSMICEGSVQCLALAYVADNVGEGRRASAFGLLSGIASCAFVCGNLSTRFLSTASTFQVAASVAVAALLYMKIFLQDSIIIDRDLAVPILSKGKGKMDGSYVKETSCKDAQTFKSRPSLDDMICLLKSSVTFSQAAIVAFFSSLSDVGLHSSLMYFLKARFHYNKDQFADLMIISGIAGTISQLLLMPILVPALGEGRLLSLGLFFSCAHMILYGIAWSSWVPYAAAMFCILFVFSPPCLRSIASKQVGPYEQGKAQGCISGICSFSNVVSPLLFSPLTALFLSEQAPFPFPGFSIICVAFASMVAFIQSMMIRVAPPISDQGVGNCKYVDA